MDDQFLSTMRREPRPEFARDLRARLRRRGAGAEINRSRLRPVLGFALATAAAVIAFAFPSVRASAQAFLDLFRVRTFVAIPVDAERLRRLDSDELDLRSLLAERVETLEEPGEARVFASPQAAGAVAGLEVRVPDGLPRGIVLERVELKGKGAARLTVDITRLRQVMETLEIRDLDLPGELDGRTVTVRVSPAVTQHFRRDDLRAELLQARSPEVELPPGTDLARLGEIGLRIVGLSPAEAHRLAQTIDWHSTLVVPVPAAAGSFREVEVHGRKGLLVTSESVPGEARESRRREGTLLLWSEGDQVFALTGNLSGVDLVQMANSLR